MNILNSYRHIRPKKVKYPIPEVSDDSEKNRVRIGYYQKLSGRVSGTRQTLLIHPAPLETLKVFTIYQITPTSIYIQPLPPVLSLLNPEAPFITVLFFFPCLFQSCPFNHFRPFHQLCTVTRVGPVLFEERRPGWRERQSMSCKFLLFLQYFAF